ncbi:MAG TPA: hypothetical protein VKQ34_03715 [Candidatus Saccharimonadales bacterium]|nr:hypothetical protein [Candidatus Saccharimonadales bacterium]
MSKNILELNGKRYDAITGALLGPARASAAKAAKKAVPAAKTAKGRAVDGFIRPTAIATAMQPKTTVPTPKAKRVNDVQAAPAKKAKKGQKGVAKNTTPVVQPVSSEVVVRAASPANSIAAHQPQHARTLMRRAVQKPVFTLKPEIKPQAPAELAPVSSSALTPKRSAASVDPSRLARAQKTLKHAAVARFSRLAGITHSTDYHIPVKTMPGIPVRQAPLSSQSAVRSPDIFEAAIAKATSHTEPPHRVSRSRRRKLTNVLALTSTFLVIASFVAFLNMPNIQLHVASVQAGFKASMPSYAPVGYALAGGVKRSGDTVSMVYRSGENNYTVTQQPTNWDDQTLLDNTLPLQGAHQTVDAGGRIVYIYNDSNAVWVAGNVRYDVVGNAPLSTTDIQQLAMSM